MIALASRARKNKIHHDPNTIERIRATVQAGQIVKVLTDHVLNGTEIAPTRITAGLGLLKKVIPDLSATQHSGDKENPIRHIVEGLKIELGAKLDRVAQ